MRPYLNKNTCAWCGKKTNPDNSIFVEFGCLGILDGDISRKNKNIALDTMVEICADCKDFITNSLLTEASMGGKSEKEARRQAHNWIYNKIYICDPSNNHNCKKSSCYLNGGPCHHTHEAKCAVDENNFEYWNRNGGVKNEL